MIVAIIVSILAGSAIVLSRTINARFAQKTSLWVSTFYNFLVGFIVSLVILFLLGRQEIVSFPIQMSPKVWIYSGGILGVFVVFISNVTVMKISSFYMTLLVFLGQMFTGILLDILLTQNFSPKQVLGGIFVAVGLSINLYFDRLAARDCKK